MGKSNKQLQEEKIFEVYKVANEDQNNIEVLSVALLEASRLCHLKAVKLFIKKKADINVVDEEGNTPLMLAVQSTEKERDETVEFLLDKKAHVNRQNKEGFTALIFAAKCSAFHCCSLLLKYGAFPELKSTTEETALMAVLKGENKDGVFELVESMVKKYPKIVEYTDSKGQSPILFAFKYNHYKVAKYLLKKKCKLDVCDETHTNLLMYAAMYNYMDLAKLLLKKGLDINQQNSNGNTALLIALGNHNEEMAKFLISKGADILIKNNNNVTTLMLAASNGLIEMVRELVGKVGVDEVDVDGWSALLYTLSQKDNSYAYGIINCLVEAGANINIKSVTLLVLALRNEYIKETCLLVKAGININIGLSTLVAEDTCVHLGELGVDINAIDDHGNFVFHAAILYQSRELIELILDRGIDINYVDQGGDFPLLFAVKNNCKLSAQLLIRRGAEINKRDDKGEVPLFYSQDEEMAKLLIDRGAIDIKNVNRKYFDNFDQLFVAVLKNDYKLAKFLLDNGADPNSRNDEQGLTPIMAAVTDNNFSMIQLLVSKGGDVNLVSYNGITALIHAIERGWLDSVRCLIDNKADRHFRSSDGLTLLDIATYLAEMYSKPHIANYLDSIGCQHSRQYLQFREQRMYNNGVQTGFITGKKVGYDEGEREGYRQGLYKGRQDGYWNAQWSHY